MEVKERVLLTNLLEGEEKTLDVLHKALKAQGWCLLDLPEEWKQQARLILDGCKVFFDQDRSYKSTFAHTPQCGYTKYYAKEAFRLLTGPLCKQVTLPKELNGLLD